MEAIEKDIERFLAVGSGDGDGYGDGSGSGSGYGFGSGSGDGDGSGSGSGSGYGFGSGSGDGDGDGYGDGFGYGSGDGDGSGYGSGDGDGSGSGYGFGYGSGSGFGSGSGDGSGSGSGVKEFNGRKVYNIDSVRTLIYAVKGDVARGAALRNDMTLRVCWIAKRGNFFSHGDTLHEAVEAVEAKWRDNRPLDDRIAEFLKTHPALDEPYGDLFDWHHILTGSCEFGRRQWCEEHGYKPTDSITLRMFLTETAGDYGGDVIRQVAKEYGLEL